MWRLVMSDADLECPSEACERTSVHEHSEVTPVGSKTIAKHTSRPRNSTADEENCDDGPHGQDTSVSNAGEYSESQTAPSPASVHRKPSLVHTNANSVATAHLEGYVAPSSYLRRYSKPVPMPTAVPETAVERDQRRGLV